jgi:hypothetical protein
MRVVCIDLQNQVTGEDEGSSPWLTLDREYDVLEIYAYPGSYVELRLRSDDGVTPALFHSAMFMTVDGQLPDSWEARVDEGGVLRLGPADWMEPGFWEAYFDREPGAVEAYERGLRRGG